MSTITPCTSISRPTASTGRIAFETDTKNIIVHDGTNWRGYQNDGRSVLTATFDGTDDRVELNSTISFLNSASAFTISAWVKISSSAGLAYFYQSGSDNFYNTISFYQSTYLDFILGKGGSAYAGTRYQGSIKDDAWHHVAGVYDGSSLTIYLDGTAPTQIGIGTSVPSATVSTAGQSPHIGTRTDDTGDFLGSMDDFAIFNSALTSTQIAAIYNSNDYPSSLQHRYTFDTNFNDSVGSINGTGQGDVTAGVADLITT